MPPTSKKTILEHFESKFIPESNTGCWLWVPGSSKYGLFCIKRVPRLAHRISWVLYRGPIPDGLLVCHKCDVPRCVNPEHLFLGTYLDNNLDRVSKGRSRYNPSRGEKSFFSKLTESQVKEIRKRHQPGVRGALIVLAKDFGITHTYLNKIIRRKTWSHIP